MGDEDPAVLGHRDEVHRRHMPRSGWRQRTSASTAMIRLGGRVDDRLVLEEELAGVQRAVQLGVQRQAVALLGVHAGVEELPAVAALVGRPMHGRVGVRSSSSRHAVARVDRHTHAEREEQLVTADGDGLGHGGQDAVDGGGRLGRARRARQQCGERASAKVRERVLGAAGVLEPATELLEELVGVFVSRATSRRCRSGRSAWPRPRRPGACGRRA